MLNIEDLPIGEMIADGIRSFPDECCGFMFGNESGDQRNITVSTSVNNAKEGDKRRRFEISAPDYMQAEKFAEDNGLLLLGIYHSHPNHPSIPSETDRLSAQVYFSYLIIAIKDKNLAGMQSWRLNEASQFEEEQII